MSKWERLLVFGIAVGSLIVLLMLSAVVPAQEHRHPPQDADIHYQFYASWLMPNGGNPRINSCCNKIDCYPTEFKYQNGTWFARRREDGAWMPVPDSKLEHLQTDPRESPDGRNHVCARAPDETGSVAVFCAVLGVQM